MSESEPARPDETREDEPQPRAHSARMTITLIILIPLGILLLLFGCQRRMIYMPSDYDPDFDAFLSANTIPIEYETRQGHQVVHLVPPRDGTTGPPERLWLVFGGNAALGGYYIDIAQESRDSGAAFLLMDYPGYGHCEGRPTERTIGESTDAVMAALASHWDVPEDRIAGQIGALGQSIGCAVALQWAEHRHVDHLVLISPFSSLPDMAKRMVGWPLCHLVLDRFNNRSRLAAIARRSDRPSVTIFHGDEDEIVPIGMARSLAVDHPDWIEFVEIPGGDHNTMLQLARFEIQEAMVNP